MKGAMKKGIRLSDLHGFNPTLGVCFWCGEEDGTIGLLGRIDGVGRPDMEAPRRTVLGYEPCDGCKARWSEGVVLIEVIEEPPRKGTPPLTYSGPKATGGTPLYPTGRFVVLRREAVDRIFDVPIPGDRAYVEAGVLDRVLGMVEAAADEVGEP